MKLFFNYSLKTEKFNKFFLCKYSLCVRVFDRTVELAPSWKNVLPYFTVKVDRRKK